MNVNVQFEGNKVIMDRVDFIKLIGGAKINTVDVKKEGQQPLKTLEQDITTYLDSKGFKRGIKGFGLIRRAIELMINDPTLINAITKKLYPALAKETHDAPSRVERAMRHAIGLAYGANKPCNSEFIAFVADEIRLKRQSI